MARRRTTRRQFMRDVGLMGGGTYFVCHTLGCRKGKDIPGDAASPVSPLTRTDLLTFTVDEFRVVEVACERILPSDEGGPGAREAGCARYVDCMLATTPIRRQKDDFLAGLASLDRQTRARHQVSFADATSEQQDAMLRRFQTSGMSGEEKFFDELLVLTLEGFLGDPRYGGNRDRVGWRFTGFEPPFPPAKAHGCGHG